MSIAMKNRSDYYLLGAYLKDLRLRRSMSISDLADKSGVSQSYISRIEMGQRFSPSIETINKLAGALGISPLDICRAAFYNVIEDSVELVEFIRATKLTIGGMPMLQSETENLVKLVESLAELLKSKKH